MSDKITLIVRFKLQEAAKAEFVAQLKKLFAHIEREATFIEASLQQNLEDRIVPDRHQRLRDHGRVRAQARAAADPGSPWAASRAASRASQTRVSHIAAASPYLNQWVSQCAAGPQPAACGRHVRTGFRQSIPSSI